MVLALHARTLRRFGVHAEAVLKQLSVRGEHGTAGKLGEAIGLDFACHSQAWLSVWRREFLKPGAKRLDNDCIHDVIGCLHLRQRAASAEAPHEHVDGVEGGVTVMHTA